MPEETFEEMCERQDREVEELEARFAVRPLTFADATAYNAHMYLLHTRHRDEVNEFGSHQEIVEVSDWSDWDQQDGVPELVDADGNDAIVEGAVIEEEQHESWENTRRICHRCGREVFTYFNGLYWCEPCAMNYDGEVHSEQVLTRRLFNSPYRRMMDNWFYKFGEKPSLERYVGVVWRTISFRIRMYENMPHEYSGSNLKWKNPFLDLNGRAHHMYSTFIETMRELNDLVFDPEGAIRVLFEEIIELRIINLLCMLQSMSIKQEEELVEGTCACNEMDALVLHFCSECAMRIYFEAECEFTMDFDFRVIHSDVQIAAIRARPEYGLPGDDWDQQMRAVGRDDHGEIVERGEEHEWIRNGETHECCLCLELEVVSSCPNGHHMCEKCEARLRTYELLVRCPVCRTAMR